jgi:hypothetical protein
MFLQKMFFLVHGFLCLDQFANFNELIELKALLFFITIGNWDYLISA